jgi:hypothetical protein
LPPKTSSSEKTVFDYLQRFAEHNASPLRQMLQSRLYSIRAQIVFRYAGSARLIGKSGGCGA